jgi:carbon storage regulator
MLVLSRKLNEEICIGPNVSVRIVEIKGNKVRLGVIAPKDMSVHRAEVVEKINAEVAAAAAGATIAYAGVGGEDVVTTGPWVAKAEESLRAIPLLAVPALPFDDESLEVLRPLLGGGGN